MPFTVVGQNAAVAALTGAARAGSVAHAYLFTGPKQVGKTLAALQFAQLLNCTGPEDDERPCGHCRACERIAAGAHPDVEMIGIGGLCSELPDETRKGHDHSTDSSRDIRICQIWRLQEVVSRAPFDARQRVMIIEPADALNRDSVAALLKTLEEPPPHVVIILVSDCEELLPDTIRSRARRVAFKGVPRALIETTLRSRRDVEATHAAELARLAGGRLGWSITALQDERVIEAREAALDRAEELATADVARRFAFAGELGSGYARDRARVQDTLAIWEEFWRDILLVAAGRAEGAASGGRLDRLRMLGSQCGVAPAARALRAVNEARQQLTENASPVLALEAMMLQLPLLEERGNPVANRLGE